MENCLPLNNSEVDTNQTEGGRQRFSSRKAHFRSFYKAQKTLVVDSESSMDKPESEMSFDQGEEITEMNNALDRMKEENKEACIPEIVEELLPKSEDISVSEGKITEYSDVRVSKEDRSKLINELDNPDIQGSHNLEAPDKSYLEAENATSDEDISDLASENPSPAPVKRKLRISLRNLSDSEDDKARKNGKDDASEQQCTDESDVEVTDLDYYKIRHQYDKVQVSKTVKKSPTCRKGNTVPESENQTDESDVEVTDMDYYKIRHQNEKAPSTEYLLSWSPTKYFAANAPKTATVPAKTSRSNAMLKLPRYESRDIPDDYNYDKDGHCTDDEDIPCNDDDFMTLDEFLAAHQTNFDLEKGKGEIKVNIRDSQDIENDEEEFEEEENTESLRESLNSNTNSVDDVAYDDYSDETDVSEVDTSVAKNHNGSAEVGEIIFMEHDDLEGTIAVYSPRKLVSSENLKTTSFKPELRDFKDETDNEEPISEQIETEPMEVIKDPEETDHEDISQMEISVIDKIEKEYPLPKPSRRILKISSSVDGDTFTTESEMPDNEPVVADEADVPTEDEMLEDFLMSPVDNFVPKFPANYTGCEGSKVVKKEKNKMRRRKVNKEAAKASDSEEI